MKGRFFVYIFIILALTSCGKFNKLRKSDDWKVKYEAALKYYESEDYYKASILFEEILPYIGGTPEAEKVNFFYAYTLYHQRQYTVSASMFKRFYDTFRRSEYAKEAYYMYAYSLYMYSPVYSLDQSSTIEAITAMQNYLNKYPYSEFREKSMEIIDELQAKLEKKAYNLAKLHYNLENLKASIITFGNFENDYPDSKYRAEIGYLKVKAAFEYAQKSIPLKQEERFRECVEFYNNYIEYFEDSPYLKKMGDMYTECLENLERLKNNN